MTCCKTLFPPLGSNVLNSDNFADVFWLSEVSYLCNKLVSAVLQLWTLLMRPGLCSQTSQGAS